VKLWLQHPPTLWQLAVEDRRLLWRWAFLVLYHGHGIRRVVARFQVFLSVKVRTFAKMRRTLRVTFSSVTLAETEGLHTASRSSLENARHSFSTR